MARCLVWNWMPSRRGREEERAAGDDEDMWGDENDAMDLSTEVSKLERSWCELEKAKRRLSQGPKRRAQQLKLKQEKEEEEAMKKKTRYCMSKEVKKAMERIAGHKLAHSNPSEEVQQIARLEVARKGYPPKWLKVEWFGSNWEALVNPDGITTSPSDSLIGEPESLSPSLSQSTAPVIVSSQKRFSSSSVTLSSISSQSAPCKSPPTATYPILKLSLGSKKLSPLLQKEKPSLKLYQEYQNLVVECQEDGQDRYFCISPSTTALLSLCRLEHGGHLLSWNPLPQNVGSFDCYPCLHMQLSPGTIHEVKFSCRLSSWFKKSFQVINAYLN